MKIMDLFSRFRATAILFGIGAMLPFAFAPYEVWPLALVSSGLFSFTLRNSTQTQCLYRAFIFGLGLFGHGASWVYVSIHDFGFTGAPLAVVLTLIFVTFLAFVFSLPFYFYGKLDRTKRYNVIFGIPCLWVLGEWLRSWLLTGFPWLYVGYAHIDSPLAAFAPLGGVFLLSFISLVTANILLLIILSTQRLRQTREEHTEKAFIIKKLGFLSLSLMGIGILSILVKNYEWTSPTNEKQSISMLQPNVELIRKWDPYFFPGIINELDESANQHWNSDIQLWPEAAVPSLYHDMQYYISDVEERATESQTNVITGILYDNTTTFDVYNGIIGLGSASGVYFKQKLVPFGEYVPLETFLRGLIAFFDLPSSVIKRGPYRPNAIAAKAKNGHTYGIAPFICYEVVYPDFVRQNAGDAELLVTISNDAWFGHSIGPHQHLEMVRMRALEHQKYFARATNTGISAIIDHRGTITTRGPQFTREVVTGEVELRQGYTPFTRFGSYPVVLLCTVFLSFSFIQSFRVSRRK